MRRQRVTSPPPVSRARKTSKEEEVRRVFQEIDSRSCGELSLDDLRSYMCDYLGFGQADAESMMKQDGGIGQSSLDFDSFRKNYARLNPYSIMERQNEVIIRKPRALCGQMVQLDGLEDCQVYICDTSAQVMIDYCKRCTVLLGPCKSAVFVRNCEDCCLWVAGQQLRTRDCQRCTFHLYAKTAPIIETSEELSFGPWAARYPKCISHFENASFDSNRNFWNAIYDFSPSKTGTSNWRIMPLEEVTELVVDLDEAPELAASPDSPLGPVTYDQLCAKPLQAGGSTGQSVANIAQVGPALPSAPTAGAAVKSRSFQDKAAIAAVAAAVTTTQVVATTDTTIPAAAAAAPAATSTATVHAGGPAPEPANLPADGEKKQTAKTTGVRARRAFMSISSCARFLVCK